MVETTGNTLRGVRSRIDLVLPTADPGSEVISSHPPVTTTPTPNLDSAVGFAAPPVADSGSEVIPSQPSMTASKSLSTLTSKPPLPTDQSCGWKADVRAMGFFCASAHSTFDS